MIIFSIEENWLVMNAAVDDMVYFIISKNDFSDRHLKKILRSLSPVCQGFSTPGVAGCRNDIMSLLYSLLLCRERKQFSFVSNAVVNRLSGWESVQTVESGILWLRRLELV